MADINLGRQYAFSWLAYQTRRWSDYEDIAIDSQRMIRVTITYLDPELIQYVILNHVLSHANPTVVDGTQFEGELRNILDRIGARNEMLFLVTITAPSYDPQAFNENLLVVKIPFEEIQLVSPSDLVVVASHDDHILSEPLHITRGPVAGYVGFPIAERRGEDCTWIMDTTWTTSLTLEIPSITLGQTTLDKASWYIPYMPLAQRGDHPAGIVTFGPAPGFPVTNDPTRIAVAYEPPSPAWLGATSPDALYWQTYWENMGRFLWYMLLLDTRP